LIKENPGLVEDSWCADADRLREQLLETGEIYLPAIHNAASNHVFEYKHDKLGITEEQGCLVKRFFETELGDDIVTSGVIGFKERFPYIKVDSSSRYNVLNKVETK